MYKFDGIMLKYSLVSFAWMFNVLLVLSNRIAS